MSSTRKGLVALTVPAAAEVPPLVLPDARARIRSARRAEGRRTAVLDDDPTGSQTVHDVTLVTVLEAGEYASALAGPGATCFVLTNSRSLPAERAARVTADVAADVLAVSAGLGGPVDLVSRSDSTLRGHVVEEVDALVAAHRQVTGTAVDGVLFVPAFPEAGRVTAGDVHYATVGGTPVPVSATEFARDTSFGYTTSDLRHFLAQRSGGRIAAADVRSIGLADIRRGGPDHVADLLASVEGGAYVVVNATEDADLDVVALGLVEARRRGRTFVHRTGPSFVRALAGIDPRPPLTPADVWPEGRRPGHGLLVVGSHVGLTNEQVAAVRQRRPMLPVELSVPRLLDPAERDGHVAGAAEAVTRGLADSDVLLVTSRTLLRAEGTEANLAIARTVSASLTAVVRRALAAGPAWVVAKGGITSHDVAVHGLGIRRATVLGQVRPGLVSVLRPVEAAPGAVGLPYVVFAGNVGDAGTLAQAVELVAGTGPGGTLGTDEDGKAEA
jgi:uncharacterized protein YgbK (DUF1537 family)